jgi:hypothetical protein
MIQIKYKILNLDGTDTVRKIEFCKNHEKNFPILYKASLQSMENDRRARLDDFLTICGFKIAGAIKYGGEESCARRLQRMFSTARYDLGVLKITVEVAIDSIPKKLFVFN